MFWRNGYLTEMVNKHEDQVYIGYTFVWSERSLELELVVHTINFEFVMYVTHSSPNKRQLRGRCRFVRALKLSPTHLNPSSEFRTIDHPLYKTLRADRNWKESSQNIPEECLF